MNRICLPSLAPFGIGLALIASATAQTNPPGSVDLVRLPTVLVTATRAEEDAHALPYATDLVDSTKLERQQPRTTIEALRAVPSVMLQKSAHGQGSPYLRGFTGFRTLMLVDGIRLNNSTFRDGPNQYWGTVDALSLERLEVVRGPGSVLYGSDAVGGTVNALSQGRTEYNDGFDWDRRVRYRYSSAEQSQIARAEVSGQWDREFGFHAGVSLKDFGNLQGGADVGRQPATGYDELDWDVKLDYFLAPDLRLVYGHQRVSLDDAWRTHSTIYGKSWAGTTVGTDQRRVFDQGRALDYLQLHAENLPGFVEEIHFSLSHHFQNELEDRVRGNGTRQVQTVDVRTLGLGLQLESPSSVGRWIYGAEYYRDWVDSSYRGYDAAGGLTTIRVQGPVADDATYDAVGAFVEDQVPLAGERLKLVLGGRYEFAQVDARRIRNPSSGATFSLADSWDNAVGSGRLLYHLDAEEHAALYVGASQGFRAPNLSDLTRWDADWGEEIPTPGVQPESFLALEGGAKFRYERFQFGATYFHTLIDDLIVRVPNGQTNPVGNIPIVAKENSGKGYIHGVELSGDVKLHRDWTWWGNFTWMAGRLETPLVVGGPKVTEPVSRLMPTTFNTGLRWEHAAGQWWAEFAATFAAQQDQLAANDRLDTQRIPPGGTPGYDVYHLRAGWRPCEHASLTVALENLADRDYRIHGSGLNEPGRNFIVTAEFQN